MRKHDPYEIAKVGIPPLAGTVATLLAIAILGVCMVIAATPMPTP